MRLLVGLGNPGPEYARHRHNIGFMAVDAIHRAHGLGAWRSRFEGHVASGMIAGEQVVALKPHTYMNDSGRSVGLAMRFFKLVPDSIVVFHDELDLAPARLRVKCGGGNGGHNGLRSLDAHLGADYWRVRMGIGHPGHKDLVSGYVLHDFAKAEMAWVTTMIDAICESVELLVTGDANRFQTKVTLALNPPKPKPPRGDDGKTPKQDKSKESN